MSAAPKIPSAFEMKRRLDLALAEDMERNRAEMEAKGASHEAVGYVSDGFNSVTRNTA